MSLVHELAGSVQACFELFGSQSDGVLLTKHDQAALNEISSILQPVLLRLQKQAVTVSESSELFAEDELLLGAVVHLRRALESLQAAVGRCRTTSHWLLRVLSAEDVRTCMQAGLADTAAALGELIAADAASDVGPLPEVSALHSSLQQHRVARHEALERLGTGLYKHMEQATEAEQVVAMLRFVVREAQNLTMRRKHSRASSSSSSRRDSDASDTSTSRQIDQDSKAAAADTNNAAASATAASGSAASSMDTGSSSDGSTSSGARKNNAGSKDTAGASSSKGPAGKPSDVPPGETSLTDVQLLLAVQQLADSKQGTQQLVLHQILSILEELHDQKAHHLKHKQSKRHAAAAAAAAAAAGGAAAGGAGQLQSVPEGYDDTIAAVRAADQQHSNGNGDVYGSGAAAAMAAGQPVTYGSAVAAVAGGLEALLWADAWDTAALTQLLELLLQASASDEEYVELQEQQEQQQQQGSAAGGGSSRSSPSSNGNKGSRRSLWGQMGAAAKAALQSSKAGAGGKGSSKGARGSSSSSPAANGSSSSAASEAAQRQRQERSHQLVASALDVLLHLTPMPAGGGPADADSAFKPLSRPGVTPYRSLALPLLAHCDTVTALSGCVWSSWPDVATKAARLLTILLRSEGAINEAGSVAAAAGLLAAASPAAAYNTFAHNVCSSGGVSGSGWHGLVTLLHSSNLASAAAAAEAIAAIGASSRSHELCSSLAASQAARALLLLLSKHQLHLGAGGAAAAALHAMSDARVRPGMHDLLISSYSEHVAGTSVPLGQSCVAIMLSSDSLAACRAARLAASLAHGINWGTAATTGGSSGSLWAETFRAGQHVLQRNRSSSSSGAEEGSPTVAGAVLLRELVLRGCCRDAPGAEADADADADAGASIQAREDLCLELLALVTRKMQSYDVGRPGKEGQVQALLQLLSALVSRISEGALCGALPDLFGVVVPLLEQLQRKGQGQVGPPGSGSGSGSSVQQAAQHLHEQLMVLGG